MALICLKAAERQEVAISVIGSALRQQRIQVRGRTPTKVIAMLREEFIGGAASLLLEQRDELPFGVQLR